MIDCNRVHTIMAEVLAEKEELGVNQVVEGTINKFFLNINRLASHKAEVIAMLDQLGDEFMDDGGQGMSLMNMVQTRDGQPSLLALVSP